MFSTREVAYLVPCLLRSQDSGKFIPKEFSMFTRRKMCQMLTSLPLLAAAAYRAAGGTVTFACLQSGHLRAGMRGAVAVQ